MREIWADVVGYEGRYEISNLGRVKSLPKSNRSTEIIMRPGPTTAGYLQVILRNYNEVKLGKPLTIHRMVAEAFIGELDGRRTEVNHKNGDKHDNRLENLEIVSRSQNIIHRIRVLGVQKQNPKFGVENHNAVLTDSKVREIKKQYAAGVGPQKIANLFRVSRGCINHVTKGRSWRHVSA